MEKGPLAVPGPSRWFFRFGGFRAGAACDRQRTKSGLSGLSCRTTARCSRGQRVLHIATVVTASPRAILLQLGFGKLIVLREGVKPIFQRSRLCAPMVRSSQPYLFASFSSQDLDVVDRVVDQLEVLGVPVWAAHRNLQPGEAWSETITHALSGASGVLIFISKTSLQSLWAKRELTSAINSQKRAFPIVVGNVDIGNLPAELRCSAPLRGVSGDRQDTIISVCNAIQQALQNDPEWQSGKTVFDARTTKEMASDISADLEEAQDQPSVEGGEENSVFVVHGHDANFVDQVVAVCFLDRRQAHRADPYGV